MDALILQLADSAFPTGGFAHSGGLEAAFAQGEVDAENLAPWLAHALRQSGRASLPFMGEAFDDPDQLALMDEHCGAFLTNAVARRASLLQGQAHLAACAAAVENERLSSWAQAPHHFAPAFGAAARVLGLEREDALRLFLFSNLRAQVSAAVRLGIVGPLEAQRLQADLAGELENVLRDCSRLRARAAAQTAPLHDLLQSTHDRLYSRLFQS
jgi:urease accessory protein